MRVVKDVEPVVSGALGPAEHFCQSLEAHRAPMLRGKPGAQIAEDVAGRKRIARSGHKSVVGKFWFPRLFVHVFWFASKLAAAARARWKKAKAVGKSTLCAALRWTELSSFWSGIHLNRNRCASSTFRTAGPALPRTQRGGCRRKGQGQPAGSELPHLMSGGVAPGM